MLKEESSICLSSLADTQHCLTIASSFIFIDPRNTSAEIIEHGTHRYANFISPLLTLPYVEIFLQHFQFLFSQC
jgi:hypothetical protein